MITRDDVLAALTPIAGRDVDVPGLGLVRLRPLLYSEIYQCLRAPGGLGDVQAVALAAVDADGKPLMTAEEWDRWAGAHFNAWQELNGAVAEMSGLNGEVVRGN